MREHRMVASAFAKAVPVQPVIQRQAVRVTWMFQDYWKYDWVLQPWQSDDASDLRAGMAAHVVKPAERKARELVARRAAAGGALQPATR